jgi:V8-like Glu-specific endopeptidase
MDPIAPVFDVNLVGPAVAFIETEFPEPAKGAGGRTIGTGTLISDRLLLTAGHIVFDPSQGTWAKHVRVRFGGPGGRFLNASAVDTTKAWQDKDSLSLVDFFSIWDVGIIVLEDPMPGIPPVPFLPVASDQEVLSAALVVGGYPADPTELLSGGEGHNRGELCAARFTSLPGAELPSDLEFVNQGRVFYPVNTVGGMSGGPVLRTGTRNNVILTAVHASGHENNTMGSAVRLRDDQVNNIIAIIQTWLHKDWDA